jgi:glycosyltransferase involved in cell wall biosynthesis
MALPAPIPTVSIVMAAYNTERYVRAAVESVLAQDFTDFELIVVDDGSTDATGAIVAALAAQDSRIVLIRQPANRGLVASLNLGASRARGRLLARHDADDLSLPGRLAAQVAFLNAHPEVGLLGTQIQCMDSDGAPLAGPPPFPNDNATLQAALLESCPFCHGSVMLRRAVAPDERLYNPDLSYGEDYDLWLRLAEVTQVANLAAPYYAFRRHSASQSRVKRHLSVFDAGRALEAALRRRGTVAAGRAWRPAARLYLEAAIYSLGVEAEALARQSLARGVALYPELCADTTELERILGDYVPGLPTEAAVRFCDRLFTSLLPRTRALARCRSRFISGLYMQAAFMAAPAERAGMRAHLWAGVRRNPAWLLNRGVLVRLLRTGPSRW